MKNFPILRSTWAGAAMLRLLILLALILLLVAPSALAQTSRGTVTGIVTDPQSAVVPNASVTLTGVLTGVKRTSSSNEAGLYRFEAVDLGEYTLTVTAAGFQTFVQRGIIVEGGQVVSKDVRLDVGETRSMVEVQADAVILQTESIVRGGTVHAAEIALLPMASRDPAQFALTLPGVSTNRFGFGVGSFVVNGSRGRSNNFMVDGSENNDVSVAGQLFQINNPDSVAEVSVQTSNFDAEYGRAGGAVVNTITKSGTNDLHGSLFYLLDVTNDDALTNTQKLSPTLVARGKPFPGTEQWYNFTLGGPIRRNRTFFFGAFQDQRQHAQNTNNLTVPSAAGRATLNQLFPKGTNPRVDLYNQVIGDTVALSQFSSVPMGNGRPNVEFGTAIVPYALKYLDRQWMVRIDHQFSDKDMLSGRYIRDAQTSPAGLGATNFFPGFSTSYNYPTQNMLLTETHVFSPATTNELRLGYNRANLFYPVDTENPLGKTLTLYTIGGGISPIGVQSNLPQGRAVNNYSLQDTASHIHGTHSFRFGLTVNQQRARQFAPIRERGEIAYGTSTGFSNFANFVDDFGGSSGSVQRDFGSPAYYPDYTRQAYFAQDRWRASKNLVLTLGVRYEYFGTPMNTLKDAAYAGLFNIDPVTLDGPYRQSNKVLPDKNNWGPAVGLAYSPSADSGILGKLFGNHKSSIRTGYQIGYDSFFNNITSNAATATPNVIATLANSVATDSPRGTPNWSTKMPTTSRPPSPLDSQTLIAKNLVNPYYQKWSFGIQRELPASLLLDVSYVGNKGTRLYANEDFNPLVPSSLSILPSNAATIPAASKVLRLDGLQGGRLTRTNGADSIYHALQVSVDRRFSKGMLAKASYTFSKSIDNTSDIFSVGNSNLPQNTSLPSIYGGLTIDRSLSFNDRTHRAVFSYVYEFPWLKQQNGVLGRVAGGWQLSGVTTFESGVPTTITNGPDADGIGSNYDRPNFNPSGTPGVRAVPSTTSPTGYINPDAGNAPIDPKTAMYVGLPAFAGGAKPSPTGNLGRNTWRLPGINNFNVNFFKNVRVVERLHAEFRAEFYNIWNHRQYGIASVSPFSPSSGSIAANVGTSLAGRFLQPGFMDGGGRVIRYQLRLVF